MFLLTAEEAFSLTYREPCDLASVHCPSLHGRMTLWSHRLSSLKSFCPFPLMVQAASGSPNLRMGEV